MNDMLVIAILAKAQEYLKQNPERFNAAEKKEFQENLKMWLRNPNMPAENEVYDFALSEGIALNVDKRDERLTSYLISKYKNLTFRKMLDVGSGRMCKLSVALARFGAEMYAIDPNIRLSPKEASKLGIKGISLKKFECDEFARNGVGTDISRYTNIVGVEPCHATEDVIRQCLKYDKPFDMLLCSCPQITLTGKHLKNYLDWYEYLRGISNEVVIEKVNKSYFATNNPKQTSESGMEM